MDPVCVHAKGCFQGAKYISVIIHCVCEGACMCACLCVCYLNSFFHATIVAMFQERQVCLHNLFFKFDY